MVTVFPNTPQLQCPVRLFLGFSSGGCMTALDKETPTYCCKCINLLEQALRTVQKSEMLLIHMVAPQRWKTFCEDQLQTAMSKNMS